MRDEPAEAVAPASARSSDAAGDLDVDNKERASTPSRNMLADSVERLTMQADHVAMAQTPHLIRRCSQRNIRPTDVELVRSYGVAAHDPYGGYRILPPSRHALKEMEAEGLSERQRRRLSTLVVITDSCMHPITAYHARPKKLTRFRRMVRNGGKGA